MKTPDKIERLVEVFDRNLEAYKSSGYKEANVRSEFIDPLFEALGWDVHNRQGYAEAYKDVITEDAIKVGGVTKAPDYCFRVGGARKFFVEAKKPSVDIRGDVSPAYQLRRYAWSAGLPLSILTDFEEFAVYDCRLRPSLKDKSGHGRVLYFTYHDYLEKWEEIAAVFSKQAVLEGRFDKYVESKGKRPTQQVDVEFLKEIEDWRNLLARNLALRNPGLGIRELNFAVQRTIDRIIFLRICEDRGIETYGQLQALLNGNGIYQRLKQIYLLADDKYNSGLFHFRREKDAATPPDELTLDLKIDDRALKEIFKRLYYPESPYEFSVLGAEILGHIYEQFLGKVIKLTAGHQAKVEEKPEVRKAGGVYYTPTYIVDYIVKNTVGKLCQGKTPKQIEKLRILDPACGSGSFLIGAYAYLADYHRDWYLENLIPAQGKEGYVFKAALRKYVPGEKPEMPIYQGKGGQWYLTTREKKRILLSNIYGVDIDNQAVEVTKLSLLLKVLENENQDSLERQMKLWRERALPDLGNNIKCGNSLIGPDFYDNRQLTLLEDEEQTRINAFDWPTEFPEIMTSGGFDAVIGNPPYGAYLNKRETHYLLNIYPNSRLFPDSYCLFIEKAINVLGNKGIISFIVPNTFCDLEGCHSFRRWILEKNRLIQIWQSGWAFKDAIVDTLVFCVDKQKPDYNHNVIIQIDDRHYLRSNYSFLSDELCKIDYRNSIEDKSLINKISPLSIQLKEIAIVKAGVKMYEKGKGIPPQTTKIMEERPFSIKNNQPSGWKVLYRGIDIARYFLKAPGEYVNYGPWLAAPRSPDIFESPKILMRRTDDEIKASLELENSICVNSCHIIKIKQGAKATLSYYYLLGILNSCLLQRIFELQNPQMIGKVFAEIKVIYVERLPIYLIDFSNQEERDHHDNIVKLVERMLELNNKLVNAKTPTEIIQLERQIKSTDNQIDRLVYELYGLTEEEIKIVEAETQ